MIQQTGSDVSLTDDDGIAVVFTCDGEFVRFFFRVREQQVGKVIVLSRAKAVEVGKEVSETGIYDDLPVSLATQNVKRFGDRLRQYGENGC